jgi:hypothetical protein
LLLTAYRLPLTIGMTTLLVSHHCNTAFGNTQRVNEIFFDNLVRWDRGEKLVNEVYAV